MAMAYGFPVSAGVLGAAFGVALGFFLFPFVFPPPEAKEQLTQAEASKLVAKGEFIHANPSDPIHYGKGGVSVYENVVFLHEDFEVGRAPPSTSISCRTPISGTRAR